MHRRILAISVALLLLAPVVSAVPEEGDGWQLSWIDTFTATADTILDLIEAAIGGGNELAGAEELEPTDEPETDPDSTGSSPNEFGGGPEPNG